MKDNDIIGWYEQILSADPFVQILSGSVVLCLFIAVICAAKAMNSK